MITRNINKWSSISNQWKIPFFFIFLDLPLCFGWFFNIWSMCEEDLFKSLYFCYFTFTNKLSFISTTILLPPRIRFYYLLKIQIKLNSLCPSFLIFAFKSKIIINYCYLKVIKKKLFHLFCKFFKFLFLLLELIFFKKLAPIGIRFFLVCELKYI